MGCGTSKRQGAIESQRANPVQPLGDEKYDTTQITACVRRGDFSAAMTVQKLLQDANESNEYIMSLLRAGIVGALASYLSLEGRKENFTEIFWVANGFIDRYKHLSHEFVQEGFIQLSLNKLMIPSISERTKNCSLSILHNLSRYGLVDLDLKAAGTLTIAAAYMIAASSKMHRLFGSMIVVCLSAGNDSEENRALIETGQCIPHLCTILKSKLDGIRTEGISFCLSEVLQQVRFLTINDRNKEKLIAEGVLQFLQRVLIEHNADVESIEECIQALLQLTFHSGAFEWMKVRMDGVFGDTIRKLCAPQHNDNSSSESSEAEKQSQVQVGAQNLLFSLQGGIKKKPALDHSLDSEVMEKNTDLAPKCKDDRGQKHIMVSYSWKQKSLVKSLVSDLQKKGFVVWRDEEGSVYAPSIQGNTAEAMAKAIETSFCVIICVSREYCLSANCRQEASYAWEFKRRGEIEIIYVMMDENYTTLSSPNRITGWLGFFVGQDLWYPSWDLASCQSTAEKIVTILSMATIEMSRKPPESESTDTAPKCHPSWTSAACESNITDLRSWSVDQVCTFLRQCNLDDSACMSAVLQNKVNGKTLLILTDEDLTDCIENGGLGLTRLQVKRLRAEIHHLGLSNPAQF
jgi:hypothetical protein